MHSTTLASSSPGEDFGFLAAVKNVTFRVIMEIIRMSLCRFPIWIFLISASVAGELCVSSSFLSPSACIAPWDCVG